MSYGVLGNLISSTHQWGFSPPSGPLKLPCCRLYEISLQNRNKNICIQQVVCHGNQYGIFGHIFIPRNSNVSRGGSYSSGLVCVPIGLGMTTQMVKPLHPELKNSLFQAERNSVQRALYIGVWRTGVRWKLPEKERRDERSYKDWVISHGQHIWQIIFDKVRRRSLKEPLRDNSGFPWQSHLSFTDEEIIIIITTFLKYRHLVNTTSFLTSFIFRDS